jgi:20S proteasome alpha/beta subunit
MAVSADLAKLLDREYEDMSLDELIKAPVQALAGVSEGDAKLLKEAFNIKTVGDMGRNKFFRAATALVDLTDSRK